MEKYWQRLVLKWFLIFSVCWIHYLAWTIVDKDTYIAFPFTIYLVLKLLSMKVTK